MRPPGRAEDEWLKGQTEGTTVCLPSTAMFEALEATRTQALVAQDLPTIERLHAPDYQLITPAGQIFTRERYLAAIAEAPFYAGWQIGPVQVRISPAMALLRYPATLTFPSGRVVECWHLDSYELREGRWQAVWSQATGIRVASDTASAP